MFAMSTVTEILHEIEALPTEERWQVLKQTREMLESEIPDSFKEGMSAIARGDIVDLSEVMQDLKTEFESDE
jgi:hypothetical protein